MRTYGSVRGAVREDRPYREQVTILPIEEPEKLKNWVGWLKEIREAVTGSRGVASRQVWVIEDMNNGGELMEIKGEVIA